MFPTHKTLPGRAAGYINGRSSIFGDTFLFLLLLLSLTLFLSARDNETIRDRLTSWKSPLALCVLYCSFCELKNCRHSPVFPIRWFICGGPQQYPPPAAISSRISHTSATLAQYLATLRPFWRLFPHNRYILTNLATSFWKKLSYRSVGRCRQYYPASTSLGICSVQWAAEKQGIQLAVTQQNHQ